MAPRGHAGRGGGRAQTGRASCRRSPEASPAAEEEVEQVQVAAATGEDAMVVESPPRATSVGGIIAGSYVYHKVMMVNALVTKLPSPCDFMHQGKVCIQYTAVERKVQVVRLRWCSPVELLVLRSSPRRGSTTANDCSYAGSTRLDVGAVSVLGKRAFDELASKHNLEVETEMAEAAKDAPELADIERARKVAQKVDKGAGRSGTSTKWGVCGSHKTTETKVSLEDRLAAFPNQSLEIAPSPTGRVLFCR